MTDFKKTMLIAVTPVVLIFFSCQKQPILNLINPNHVVARQIVAIEGSDLGTTDVLWNAGGSGQKLANTTLLSAHYFQIPEDALPGSHAVQLRNAGGTSSTIANIDVQPLSGRWPYPRIEDVTLNNFSINNERTAATAWLLIAVANVDAKAEVRINGTLQQSFLYSAIPSDYFPANHAAATYFYPVYHYGQLLVPINLPPGTTLSIQVKNIDGHSATTTYELARDEASLDSDGDGLTDYWEINGYRDKDGKILNLAAFGCNPHKKDILVEVDWVSTAAPNPGIWNRIENIFANAPVLNPDGSQGIAIHIDRGQNGIFDKGGTILSTHVAIGFGTVSASGYKDFFSYKIDPANFDPLRVNVFHYCIFGNARLDGASGEGELWGNDFYVSFVTFSNWGNIADEVGTFLHELGHNLNLYHGGISGLADQDETFKVNQPSIMNYRYQFDGIPRGCDINPDGVYTFSRGMLNLIAEQFVVEATGICDDADIDFDGDKVISTAAQMINVNPGKFDKDNTDVHFNYDEWGNIQLNFRAPGSAWKNN